MAARIFKRITTSTNLTATKILLHPRYLKYFRHNAETTYFASRSMTSPGDVSELENLSSTAEKVVGFQTSLLRCLLSDEISSVLVHSKKLVGSRHPLLKTARSLVYDGVGGLEAVGLIVLLMSRCGEGLMKEGSPLGQEPVSGIQQKQRKLAEVAEMINAGYMVHLGMVNTSDFETSDDRKTMNFGNKITVLTGDFFLAKASVGLSELENAPVVDIMASVIGDIVEGETSKDYKSLNDTTLVEWEEVVFKSRGSLFAKSCLASLKLCSLPQCHQDAASTFGKNLALLQQLSKDYQNINMELQNISLNNVAVIQNKHILPPNVLEKTLNSIIPVDEKTKLKLQSSEIADKIERLAKGYGNIALESLECFPSSEAKSCLEDLVRHFMSLPRK